MPRTLLDLIPLTNWLSGIPKISKSQKLEKKNNLNIENFFFAYVSEHCASFGHFWKGRGGLHAALWDRAINLYSNQLVNDIFILVEASYATVISLVRSRTQRNIFEIL